MGLLDGLLGNVLGGMMGGQQQGASPLINVVLGMLSNNGAQGGLGGLMQQFQQAGLGQQIESWVGTGQNLPVSADQISQALGSGQLAQIAQQLGVSDGAAAGQLAQVLPEIINHLTPSGQAPAGGLGNAEQIMGMLGGLLKR
ncbi:MAG: DUF937 domain-containing protein [Betaproteobacteria bacterium]|nr:DUF937 domain-containing protein [Betaproteobacteria bacterium]